MCIGVPLQVVEAGEEVALCRTADGLRPVDVRLVGPVRPGEWLLTFLGAARERLEPEQARRILDALEAVARAAAGEGDLDHLFADLTEREPALPPFLQPGDTGA